MDSFVDSLLARLAGWIPAVGMALLIAFGFWVLAWMLSQAVTRFARRTGLHRNVKLIELFGRIVRVTLVLLGAVTALGTLGVNVTGLVAGLGLTGFALGFAFRDMISNLLAGVLILVYRPLDLGDDIDFKGLKGKVVNIDLRYTTLDAEGERILVPNSNLFSEPIRINKLRAAEGLRVVRTHD